MPLDACLFFPLSPKLLTCGVPTVGSSLSPNEARSLGRGAWIPYRMATRPSPPGPPPTLAYLAKQAAGIDAECRDCRRRVVLGFEPFLDRYGDVPFPDFARLMKCSTCGSRNVEVRPSWAART